MENAMLVLKDVIKISHTKFQDFMKNILLKMREFLQSKISLKILVLNIVSLKSHFDR